MICRNEKSYSDNFFMSNLRISLKNLIPKFKVLAFVLVFIHIKKFRCSIMFNISY